MIDTPGEQKDPLKAITTKSTKLSALEKGKEFPIVHDSVFKTNHAVMLLIDPADGQIVDANDAAIRFYGWSYEALVSKKISEINTLPPGEVKARMEEARQRSCNHFHFKHFIASGRERHVEVDSIPVVLDDTPLLYSIIHDINDRIEAQEAQQESEERFHLLVEAGFHGLFIHVNHVVVEANQQMADILGVDREKLIGSQALDWVAHEHRENVVEYVSNNPAAYYDVDLVHADGHLIHAEAFGKNCQYHGEPARIVGFRDVTEDRKTQRAMDNFFSQSLNLHLIANFDGIIQRVNQGWQETVGYQSDELVNTHFMDLVHPADRYKAIEEFVNIKNSKALLHFESRWRSRHGDYRLMEWSAVASVEDRLIYAMANDITDKRNAEEALKHERDRAQQYLDIAGVIILVLDPVGTITLINQKGCDILGYNYEELIGRNWFDTCLPHDRTTYWNSIDDAILNKNIYKFREIETTVVCKDGSLRRIRWQNTEIKDETGLTISTLSSGEDITARKEAEQALQKSEMYLRRVLNTTADGFVAVALDGRVIDVNSPYCKMSGYTRKELLSMYISDLDADMSLDDVLEKINLTVAQQTLTFEARHRRKDGSIFILENSVAYMKEETDCIVCFCRDITERKRVEEQLDFLGKTISQIQDVVTMTDLEGRITYVNDACCKLLGRSAEELIGLSVEEYAGSPEQVEAQREIIQKTLKDGSWHGEVVNVSSDGEEHIIDCRTRLVYDGQSNPTAMIGISTDITDRKRDEAEREKLREELLQSQKIESIGRLAGGVAHDFNNMLNVIIGHADYILEDLPLENPMRESLLEIMKAAEHSAELTHQLLAFARRQTITPKALDLNDTINSMLKMLRRLIGEDIELIWKPGRDLELIYIDPVQIDQILANLAVNARDAILGVGWISIKTENLTIDEELQADYPDLRPGEYVLLTFSDNGKGIEEEIQSQIFEPFFTTKEFGVGTGLGLATIYGIAKQNDGQVIVKSQVGAGTSFKILFPAHRDEERTDSPQKDRGTMPTGNETILLVEDEKSILTLAKSMLERTGYRVFATQSTDKAIELAQTHCGSIDLLITDVVMPHMNGRVLHETINSRCPGLKHLYMSGYPAEVIANQGILDPGMNFIQKPFNRKGLAQKVREALDRE